MVIGSREQVLEKSTKVFQNFQLVGDSFSVAIELKNKISTGYTSVSQTFLTAIRYEVLKCFGDPPIWKKKNIYMHTSALFLVTNPVVPNLINFVTLN